MKRILLTITFLLLTLVLLAPNGTKVLYIESKNAINYYNPLIKAIVCVESSNGKILFNPRENAVGWFQIRPIRLKDYNERTHSHYTMKDLYDYNISRKIFLYYTNNRKYELVARSWNGSGKETIKYWNKVRGRL